MQIQAAGYKPAMTSQCPKQKQNNESKRNEIQYWSRRIIGDQSPMLAYRHRRFATRNGAIAWRDERNDESAAWKERNEQVTPEEFEDAKSLWKFFYAQNDFKQAENACLFILKHNIHENHPAYYPLVAAIYVLYGRPFKKSEFVGKLSRDIVPAKFQPLHDVLIDHRDQLYAHTDGKSFDVPGQGAANQVRVRVSSNGARLIGTQFFARPPTLGEVVKLCQAMQKQAAYHIGTLQKRHREKIPKELGEYPINIFNADGDFFLPRQPPIFRDDPSPKP
jgi:hypothetical protein